MRVLYVAKHNQPNSNDDEGAVAHALEQLGHDVVRIPENMGSRVLCTRGDLVLFHKWDDVGTLRHLDIPKVFWFFDLVSHPDPELRNRCAGRIAWMQRILPLVNLGFVTDGDWQARDTTGKLIWLPQGADERYIGDHDRHRREKLIPILFTGHGLNCGVERRRFVTHMRERYGDKFHHIDRGVYCERLGRTIAMSKIVVAPSGPVTDRYWSNRAYLMMGSSGCLLHPWCGLKEDFQDGVDLAFYDGFDGPGGLNAKIEHYLNNGEDREKLCQGGLYQVKAHHLYVHRVAKMIEIVKERLGI